MGSEGNRCVVGVGQTDLEVCRHDRADTEVRAPAALDLVGVTVLWIERLAPSPGRSATLSPTGARDTIQSSARPCHASFPITAQRRQPRVPPLPRDDLRQTEPACPRERAGVRAKWPLSWFRISGSPAAASNHARPCCSSQSLNPHTSKIAKYPAVGVAWPLSSSRRARNFS